jgi:mRNA interferase MazF
MMKANQYEVYIVNLDPTVGAEIKKTRPCVIISPDEMNRYLDTIVIAPITSRSKKYPTRVEIQLEGDLNYVVIDQIRTIDKSRLIKLVSRLSQPEIRELKRVVREAFVD